MVVSIVIGLATGLGGAAVASAQGAIDNSALSQPGFREHKAASGPVLAVMSDAAKELVKTMGVSGVNVIKDGKEVRAHNPHNTLVYSMAKFDPSIQGSMNQVADEFNKILPDGIASSFRDVSIVEI